MELTWGGILLGVLGILAAAFANKLANDFRAWCPRITAKLIKRAVRRLPEEQRSRFEEEWTSYIQDIPGELGKILSACGLLVASRRMACDFVGRPASVKLEVFRTRCISAGVLILISPVMLGIGLLIRIEMPGPVMFRSRRLYSDGKPVAVLQFRTHGFDYKPTRIGAFLRQTSLDELPHLINMLHGDFTLKDYLKGEKLWRVIWRGFTGR